MPLAAIAGIGLAGSIGGALIGSNAAGNAASAQANAANQAAQLQFQASQNSLDFQKQQYGQSQANLAPWLQSGAGALANLDWLLGIQPPTTQGSVGAIPNMSGDASALNPLNKPLTASPGNDGKAGSISQLGGNAFQWTPGSGNKRTFQFAYNDGKNDVYQLSGGGQGTGININYAVVGPDGQIQWTGNPPQKGTYPSSAPGSPGGQTTDLSKMVNPQLGQFGSLMQPFGEKFQAPTGLTEQNDPGFQARLKLGTDALERSAAARGGVLTGGTAKGLNQFAQDYASNEYGNVYARNWNEYANRYNQYQQNQTNQFNRLGALSGIGQQTAQQLGMMGQNASNNVSNNLLSTAAGMGQAYQNAGAANASGYVGAANAWQGALGGATSNIQQLLLMKQLGMA